MSDLRSDAELLAATPHEPLAFGEFYARHEETALRFVLRQTGDPDLAADIVAETFAQALISCERFKPGPTPAIAWLLGIARNVLAMSWRRGRVEASARKRLAMQPVVLEDTGIAEIDRLSNDRWLADELASLPPDQREAITARVIDEREYREIALATQCSELAVRKRVSRGLSVLRNRIEMKT